jgi:hypothetical protein
MLQLLLERGQRYADLASVLGVDETEVRSRARQALTELAGADPDRNVGLTDYLLGQADPIGRADAVRHLKDDPEDLSLAIELSQKLLLLAPEADLPRLPGEERRPRVGRRSGPSTGRGPILERLRGPRKPDEAGEADRTTLTRRQAQLSVLLGCGAVLLVVAILAVTGTFSGGSDATTTAATTTASGNQQLAGVKLTPPNGGNASGSALFSVAGGSRLNMDVKLNGLKPAPKGQAYVMWFVLAPSQSYPVPSVLNVSKDGSYENRITIPATEILIAQRARSIDVSLAPVQAVASAINAARKQKSLVRQPGVTVLSGNIPASRSAGAGGANG